MPGFPGLWEAHLVGDWDEGVGSPRRLAGRRWEENLQRTGPGGGSERTLGAKWEAGHCVHFMTLSQRQRSDQGTIPKRKINK